MFELNFPEKSSFFSFSSVAELEEMIKLYFKSEKVNARCKNEKCKLYPMNILKDK